MVALHIRAPELRAEERRRRGVLHRVEHLAVPFPDDCHRPPEVIVLLRQQVVDQIVVGLRRSPARGVVAEFLDHNPVIFVAAPSVRHTKAGQIGCVVQASGGIGVLHLKDGLGSVLHPERDVRKRVLIQRSVDFFDLPASVQRHLPLLVPLGHLGDEHIAHGRSDPVVSYLGGSFQRKARKAFLKVLDKPRAGRVRRHSGKLGHLCECRLVSDILGVERNIPEERCHKPIVEGPHNLALGRQRSLHLLVKVGALDSGDGLVAVAYSFVAVVPDIGAETRVRRRDVQLRVLRR